MQKKATAMETERQDKKKAQRYQKKRKHSKTRDDEAMEGNEESYMS